MQHSTSNNKRIGVVAYSGYKGEEAPRSFFLDDIRVEVLYINKSWVEEPLHEEGRRRFFKVRGSDGFVYTLYYDEMKSEWFLAE